MSEVTPTPLPEVPPEEVVITDEQAAVMSDCLLYSCSITLGAAVIALIIYLVVRYKLNPPVGKRRIFLLRFGNRIITNAVDERESKNSLINGYFYFIYSVCSMCWRMECMLFSMGLPHRYRHLQLPECVSLSLGVSILFAKSLELCLILFYLLTGYVFGCVLSTCFTCGITMHLFLIFIRKDGSVSKGVDVKRWTVGSVFVALLASCIPLFANGYGWLEDELTCWYMNDDPTKSLVLQWVSLYGWSLLGVIWCTYVAGAVILKLFNHDMDAATHLSFSKARSNDNRQKSSVKGDTNSEAFGATSGGADLKAATSKSHLSKPNDKTIKIAQRLVLYPLLLILTQGSLLAVETEAIVSGQYRFLPYAYEYTITGLQGFFNMIIFVTDRALVSTFINYFRGEDYNDMTRSGNIARMSRLDLPVPRPIAPFH
ncbi:hypothetical protein BKA69DRAFT_117833 [Paraphysoderma sedebokerense]|nr:hypothetical protein BKA69DRAFT_117833 [Paraphysoderma sedebokerense]